MLDQTHDSGGRGPDHHDPEKLASVAGGVLAAMVTVGADEGLCPTCLCANAIGQLAEFLYSRTPDDETVADLHRLIDEATGIDLELPEDTPDVSGLTDEELAEDHAAALELVDLARDDLAEVEVEMARRRGEPLGVAAYGDMTDEELMFEYNIHTELVSIAHRDFAEVKAEIARRAVVLQ